MVLADPEPAAGHGGGHRLPLVGLVVLVVSGLLSAPAPAIPIDRSVAVPLSAPPDPGAGRVPALRTPVAGAVVRGFELPAGPYGPGHRGLDIAVPVGERARAPTAGRVTFAGPVTGAIWVSLAVAPGVVVTLGPLLDRAVATGRPVRTGDPLGRVAPGHGRVAAGHGSAPGGGLVPAAGAAATLHLSLRVDGEYVDPLPYLVDRPRPRLAPLLAPGGLPRP
jgi:murein DD-endopeptidase MepM/ murein hydrolase activator NlpD